MKKLHIFKPLSGLLAMLAVSFCLFSCGTGGSGSKQTNTTASETLAAPSGEWSIGSAASFAVVTPKTPTSALTAACNTLLDAFESKTGVRPETKTDAIKRGVLRDTQSFELLLGRTDYDETKEVLKTISDGQFAIALSGHKLVLTAAKDVDIAAAVNYFIEHYINAMVATDGVYNLSTVSYVSPAVDTTRIVTVNGTDISEFTIVYETERVGYEDIAKLLQSSMAELGYQVNVVADTVADSGKPEILVGKTNRTVSASAYGSGNPALLTYSLQASGNKLQIVSGGPFSARECVAAMMFRFFGADNTTYQNGILLSGSVALADNAIPEGTDVRIMTSNILAARWGEDYDSAYCYPVSQRAEIYAAVLIACKPDAVGVQETDQKWIDQFPYYLNLLKTDYNLDYSWKFTDFDGKQTLTTIMYRCDKYDLVDSGIENFTYFSSPIYNLRLTCWVQLQPKAGFGTQGFILMNTHWGFENEQNVFACSDEHAERLNALKTKGVPIFSTGDYNSNPETEQYQSFISKTGVRSAREVAIAAGTCPTPTVGGCREPGYQRYLESSFIDHVLGTGAWNALKYETVLGTAIYMSDHSPQIADIQFTN